MVHTVGFFVLVGEMFKIQYIMQTNHPTTFRHGCTPLMKT